MCIKCARFNVTDWVSQHRFLSHSCMRHHRCIDHESFSLIGSSAAIHPSDSFSRDTIVSASVDGNEQTCEFLISIELTINPSYSYHHHLQIERRIIMYYSKFGTPHEKLAYHVYIYSYKNDSL